MNILVVSQFYSPEPFRLNEICEEFVRRGHKVTVLTANPSYPDGDIYQGYNNIDTESVVKGVKVIRCKARPRYKGTKNLALNYLSFLYNAERRIRNIDETFDIVYTYQLSPVTSSIPAIRFAKKRNIPCVLYCLDIWPESVINFVSQNGVAYKIIDRISKYVYINSDKLIVTSPSFSDYLAQLCNINKTSITWIPQHSNDLGCVSKKIDEDCLNFMFLGNVGEAQFVDGLIKAVSKIDDSMNFKLHIVGSGSELDNVMSLAENLGVGERVVFHGRQPKEKMPDYYKMADVCVVSLINEGAVGLTIPGKLQEYMSAGKPILASINGDAQTVINEARCGLCSDADSVEGVVSNILRFIEMKKSDLDKLGEHARRYYLDHFTLEKHVDELEKEFNKLVNK